jgi:putative ABC transport system permease protein
VKYLRLIFESLMFAGNALKHNIMRTVLSLAGVSIGIFLIIAVLTVVDSLERSIRDSFKFLGAEVIYVEKWPWINTPNYPFWKYFKRPMPTYRDYTFLKDNLSSHTGVTIMAMRGGNTIKRSNSSVSSINIMGVGEGYLNVYDVKFMSGRFFTLLEMETGRNVVVIGKNVVDGLFEGSDPLGKEVKIRGMRFTVIGVLEEEGENLLNTPSNDENVILPYNAIKRMFSVDSRTGIYTFIAVKGQENDIGLVNLEYDARGVLRKVRGLRPDQEDNFALNKPEMIANQIGKVFDVLTLAGAIIGGFSILVGAFGIANIMFVSVNERIGIIGIQKSMGAKNYFILFQFLFEAVFLSLIGGFLGLLLVYLGTFIPLGSFVVILNLKNIILGVTISTVVGVLSGIVPAAMAARLDPVVAIRSN